MSEPKAQQNQHGDSPHCPLCGCPDLVPGWYGSTRFEDQVYEYRKCAGCASFICTPMPDVAALASMYGPKYLGVNIGITQESRDKNPQFVLDCLARAEAPGVFLDYGCGAGELLIAARAKGWEAIGFEYDADVAQRISAATGCLVTHEESRLLDEAARPRADVLNLGDVIEHLTDLDHQFPQLLKLLKPGGILVAQGPLEANPNLFIRVLELFRRLRPGHIASMPPYHVLLATSRGQKAFFDRHGLETTRYRLCEIMWPAPQGVSRPIVSRNNFLWAIKRLSMALTRLRPRHWGNRYLFEGRKPLS